MSKAKVQEFEYKTEMKQLLHLIVHSLYTHPEVFLRELISNASDALNKVRFRTLTDQDVLDPKAKLEITPGRSGRNRHSTRRHNRLRLLQKSIS